MRMLSPSTSSPPPPEERRRKSARIKSLKSHIDPVRVVTLLVEIYGTSTDPPSFEDRKLCQRIIRLMPKRRRYLFQGVNPDEEEEMEHVLEAPTQTGGDSIPQKRKLPKSKRNKIVPELVSEAEQGDSLELQNPDEIEQNSGPKPTESEPVSNDQQPPVVLEQIIEPEISNLITNSIEDVVERISDQANIDPNVETRPQPESSRSPPPKKRHHRRRQKPQIDSSDDSSDCDDSSDDPDFRQEPVVENPLPKAGESAYPPGYLEKAYRYWTRQSLDPSVPLKVVNFDDFPKRGAGAKYGFSTIQQRFHRIRAPNVLYHFHQKLLNGNAQVTLKTIDERLWERFQAELPKSGKVLHDADLREMAMQVKAEIDPDGRLQTFKASVSWLTRWKRKYGIQLNSIYPREVLYPKQIGSRNWQKQQEQKAERSAPKPMKQSKHPPATVASSQIGLEVDQAIDNIFVQDGLYSFDHNQPQAIDQQIQNLMSHPSSSSLYTQAAFPNHQQQQQNFSTGIAIQEQQIQNQNLPQNSTFHPPVAYQQIPHPSQQIYQLATDQNYH